MHAIGPGNFKKQNVTAASAFREALFRTGDEELRGVLKKREVPGRTTSSQRALKKRRGRKGFQERARRVVLGNV